MRIFKTIILSYFLLSFLLMPGFAGADVIIDNPLASDSLEDLIDGIINFIFWVATVLAPLMIVIAAFYFVTSAGNPQQIATAKKIILYTLIGYAIILLSRGLILVLREILGVTT
ncbi:MAG TPA: hypothetical protein ENI19_03900 [Candidatus Nealsonbacteria bacterium]|uniref:Uncharacterized protein n=1 Tax=marine sediment metagenome TaxID=412755 RepID=A0A0F9UJE2_9ZZZZ|nr:hypothetical protein [Candidatus Nealsonbacteria bacterium]HEB46812.1 hypothetical protein [Candidatus Nealsonbacteria bacterium]